MTSRILLFSKFLLIIILSGCKKNESSKASLFSLLPPSYTGVTFANTVTENDSMNLILNEYLYNGGGVAIGDVNNDDLPDLFFSGNMQSSKLYLNKGNFKFEDITEAAGVITSGWATGVNMVDINADGYLDIYVCMAGPLPANQRANKLFVNNKNLTFTEQAKVYQLADTSYSTQAAFLDYDRDGDLDMYLLNHVLSEGSVNPNLIRPKLVKGENENTDKLFRNDGLANGHPIFSDVSKQSGITIEGYGLGIAISDINQDGWPDIYVCNDYLSNDLLWINNHDGTFTNRIGDVMKHQSNSSMGNDVADINNDGLQDVMTLDMMPEDNYHRKMMHVPLTYDRREMETKLDYQQQSMRNMLQVHQGFKENGDPYFSEVGYLSNVYATDWSWSALLADFDNDGLKDIHITNGFVRDLTNGDFIMFRQHLYNTKTVSDTEYIGQLMDGLKKIPGRKIKNYFYKNQGQLRFENTSDAWGITQESFSNGAAYADLDNDGDLDLVTNNINDAAFIFRNNVINQEYPSLADSLNFIRIKLSGDDQNVNGLGAMIKIAINGSIQLIEQNPCRGFMSSIDNRLHIGLGNASKIDSLYIHWPNGQCQVLKNVLPNQTLVLDQKHANPDNGHLNKWKVFTGAAVQNKVFKECEEELNIDFAHQEESYIDYKSSPLLPQKYSQLGPGISVGDINSDGLDDFFIGNGFKHSGELFFQQKNGTFNSRTLTSDTKFEEDMGSLLFDADGDHDLDLYIVSGTSEFDTGSPYLQDRLYFNDGHGNFKLDKTALPILTTSGSCVVAGDMDGDNDLDLFVGGRQIPGKYPYSPRSYILQNNKGHFKDVTATLAPDLQNVGMVTAALWTDFNNDRQTDLIVVGEWMPITMFKNSNGSLSKTNTSIGNTSVGWWNSIAGGDFDNDGDTDYIAGNLGLNSKYKASVQNPLKVAAADFDNNGSVDAIMGLSLIGKDGKQNIFPAPQREVLVTAMPPVRLIFNTFDDYASTDYNTFISRLKNKSTFSAEAVEMRSVYIENTGEDAFEIHPLPLSAQLAPIFGITIEDYDGDQNLDVLLSGNSYSSDVITGRYDASYGIYLKGDGQGNFIEQNHSGFYVDGDCKGMAQLYNKNQEPVILVARNDNTLLAFKATRPFARKPKSLLPNSAFGWTELTLTNGKKRKVEFYFGSGYLSQSSTKIIAY